MTTSTMRVLPDPATNFKARGAAAKLLRIAPLRMSASALSGSFKNWKPWLIFLLLLSIWFIPATMIHQIDPTAVAPDQSQWLMVILSLITFLMIMAICWWLLNRHWQLIGLPPVSQMVSHFKLVTLWQQLVFYLLSFALVLLAALACLIAIC
ncbi:hypothetical protein OQY15_04550 [Pedobacter sp. MC2016-15]|uniref:hypothetical protein n=1 Tax=Pedobacter sp. MC2016-15 TaxID=2994473 RepID=UPI002245D460|nr:hypothetical protein [Pedobacter sp. MC2016-15]MCX2478347.1 hypothetical protein [Pedobacter sp. MC2016-15]